jgi:hypothetical protein
MGSQWWLSNILGGVVRWVTFTIIATVCLGWGFAPNEFLAELIKNPSWLTSPWMRTLVVVAGVAIFLVVTLVRRRSITPKEPTGVDVGASTKPTRPLPIALTVESLGSYMRTSPRVGRLDDAIAKIGRKQMDNGPTMAFGLFPDLKGFGVANVAEVDALLEEKEELVLHSATHWTFKGDVPIGACVWELCKVLKAEQGNDNYTKKIIDDYLAAKAVN